MDDLISRQAAMDALDAICERECEYSKPQRAVMCGACRLGSAFDVVDELPSAQQWIPVSERLPEKSGRYLVTCEQWGAWEVDWNIWYTTPRPGWLWEKGITAWMPLPEPWKEVTE